MQNTQSYGALKKKILREAAWLVLRSGRRPLGEQTPMISLRVLERCVITPSMDDSPFEYRMDILTYVVTFLF